GPGGGGARRDAAGAVSARLGTGRGAPGGGPGSPAGRRDAGRVGAADGPGGGEHGRRWGGAGGGGRGGHPHPGGRDRPPRPGTAHARGRGRPGLARRRPAGPGGLGGPRAGLCRRSGARVIRGGTSHCSRYTLCWAAWARGRITSRSTLTWEGRVIVQVTTSAMSSAVRGSLTPA